MFKKLALEVTDSFELPGRQQYVLLTYKSLARIQIRVYTQHQTEEDETSFDKPHYKQFKAEN